jgi:cell division septation protein DedD
VDAFVVSDDGDFLAYSVDTTGFREYTLRVRDLRRGADGPESIARVSSAAWAADSMTLFYVTEDDAKRPCRLWRHRRGEDGARLVHEETDERFTLSIRRSRSLGFLFLEADSHSASEVRFLAATDPEGAFRLFLPREPELEYEVDHGGEVFWVRINDRGPFVGNRIVDLSYSAATRLDIVRTGTAFVELRTIAAGEIGSEVAATNAPAPGEPAAAPPPATPGPLAPSVAVPSPAAAAPAVALYIQVGAFADADNAQRVLERLQSNGVPHVFSLLSSGTGRALRRVRIGPIGTVEEFDQLAARLAALGYPEARLAND